jgi:hypothetical protein
MRIRSLITPATLSVRAEVFWISAIVAMFRTKARQRFTAKMPVPTAAKASAPRAVRRVASKAAQTGSNEMVHTGAIK